uniref:protein-glutamine gamma-glutamyltransferase n=1 Tax=Crassostrea virginica TaxID=6565 RepID=A0A8B8E858_CRAVI|nr:uncharacterized protein LOC111132291 [Crassostrea virginica]
MEEEKKRKKEEERLKKERKEAEELLEKMKEKERSEREERERLERERASKRPLNIKDVDLNIPDNCKAHRTDRFELTQLPEDKRELVVRRGQEFSLTLRLDQEYDKTKHDLELHFTTGANCTVLTGTDVNLTVDENGGKTSSPKNWHARLIGQKKCDVIVGVFTPCNCIIGEWSLFISAKSKVSDNSVQVEEYECSTDINILLNPWCKDDLVYMKNTDLLNEYVINDQGAVFQGSSDKIGAKVWNLAQYEDGVLEVCFSLLRKANEYTVGPDMANPVTIARAVSAIINSNDDDGVLVGNWSGDYSGGTRPTGWMNSADILLQYSRNHGEAVKYGQCWVFSAVVTTVCRAIGLPCKSVTCFDSAHDTDGSTTIDNVFVRNKDGYLERDDRRTNDSIWNFHVWNEVWMARQDLKNEYDGWQVIDATPQELSDAVFCCGPAPVAAVKTGNCKIKYDLPFVFAEVNSDVIRWEYVNKTTWINMGTDINRTGSKIYSKKPDGKPYSDSLTINRLLMKDNPHDVTSDYKFPEGSREERRAVDNAAQACKVFRGKQIQQDVKIELVEKDGIMVGEDFTIEWNMINTSQQVQDISRLHLELYSKFYTGEIKSKIFFKPLSGFKLEGKKGKPISVKVTSQKYLDKIAEQANMEVIVSATVTREDNSKVNIVKVDNFRLRRPDIEIRMPTSCKRGEEIIAELSFKNFLPIPMTKCILHLDGAGFEKIKEMPQRDLPAHSEWKLSVKVKAKRAGLEQFLATFDSEEVPDITGRAEVQVKCSVRVISTMYTRLYRNPLSTQPPTQPDGSTPSGGGSSTPTTIASYGPPRVKERPWARDKRLTNNLSTTEDDADNEEAKASNEELAKELHVVSVDVCMAENTKNHRTNQYACTSARKNQEGKTLPPELVVRRGQGFTVKIEFNQPVSRERHCLHLIFMTGEEPRPSDFTLVKMDPFGPADTQHGWTCKIKETKDCSLILVITPSSSCVIGEWLLSIMTSHSDKGYCYEFPEDINILLNPWCKDDPVYMDEEKYLEEYILNDKGVLFCGNYRQIGARPWNFGQFEEGVLEICFHLLRRANGGRVNAAMMSDPVKMSRTISKILNCQDDEGVLVGNWTGDYEGGRKPTHWTGSSKILLQYEKNNGEPVCFGQCWVFSGLVTTVCRALGLPARSVTNFSSAHDTNCSLTIDTVMCLNKDGGMDRIPELSNDSVWNFHVWNEVWMARPDLGKDYNGWQAIDATPQELSGGSHCCGPAPVAAIKLGDCSVNFDTAFVFSEVNADKIVWHRLKNHTWQMLYCDTDDVGRCISTKTPDGKAFSETLSVGSDKFREDITDSYKYKEGSLEERLSVMQASKSSKVDQDSLNTQLKDVKLSILDNDGVMVGEDFTVQINVKKTCDETRTIVKLTVDIYTKRYTGDIVSKVTSHSFTDISLEGKKGERQTLSHEVKGATYVPHLVEQCAMEVRATALFKENGAIYVKTDEFRLRRPDLSFEIPQTPKKGVPFDLIVSFKNSLPNTLTKCTLDLDGVADYEEVKIPDVPANSLWKHTVKVKVNRSGRHQISGSFDSSELTDISGYINFTLQE